MMNLITDIEGVAVGHATDMTLGSGVTAIIFDTPAVASGSVLGGAPGGRDTEGFVTHVAVGGMKAPALVAAVQEVKEDGLRYDGYARRSDFEPSADFAQARLNAASRIQPEGRTAGKHEGINGLHGHGWIK